MFVTKNITLKGLITFTGLHLIWLTGWAIIPALLYQFTPLKHFSMPWLPISLIGTSVAFYAGFKNSQAYDRIWEARKIWGSIINSSRSWGTMIKVYVSNQFTEDKLDDAALNSIRKKLIYRHIGWLYTLRSQLLIPMEWEHIGQRGYYGEFSRQRSKQFGIGLFDDNITEHNLNKYLPDDEYQRLINYRNSATQIIDQQAQDLLELRTLNLIEDFRHIELQKTLNDFYDHQGRAERIKKFPLPRQYASMSFVFVCLFIFMLPFGMITEFMKLGEWGIWASVPFTIIVGWIFVVMELIGDYSENPFEGLGNDVPMYSICRTIEIDLLEMLGEQHIPKAIQPINGILL